MSYRHIYDTLNSGTVKATYLDCGELVLSDHTNQNNMVIRGDYTNEATGTSDFNAQLQHQSITAINTMAFPDFTLPNNNGSIFIGPYAGTGTIPNMGTLDSRVPSVDADSGVYIGVAAGNSANLNSRTVVPPAGYTVDPTRTNLIAIGKQALTEVEPTPGANNAPQCLALNGIAPNPNLPDTNIICIGNQAGRGLSYGARGAVCIGEGASQSIAVNYTSIISALPSTMGANTAVNQPTYNAFNGLVHGSFNVAPVYVSNQTVDGLDYSSAVPSMAMHNGQFAYPLYYVPNSDGTIGEIFAINKLG